MGHKKTATHKIPTIEPSPAVRGASVFVLILGTIWGFLTVQFVVAFVFANMLHAFNPAAYNTAVEQGSIWLYAFIIFLVESALIAAVYGVSRYFFAKSNPLTQLGLQIPSKDTLAKIVLLPTLFFVVFLAVLQTIMNFIESAVDAIDTNQMQNLAFDAPTIFGDQVLIFIALVILTPIAEEMVFRGFMYGQIRKYIAVIPAIIVSSIIFGLAHAEFLSSGPVNWAAAIDVGLFAVFLAAIYEHTKSLWSAIILHAIKNGVAFYALFL